MSEYFIQIGSEQRGPFSRFQLESQPISESTLVRQDGTDDWRRASDFPELQQIFRRGGSDNQYGDFRDVVAEASPYASPRADVRDVVSSESRMPRTLGIISCLLGGMSWLILLGFFGFVIYMTVQEEQGGGEPAEAVMIGIGLSFCFNFVLMLAGMLIGAIAIFLPGQGKGWGITGLILNCLPLLMLGGLIIIGAVLG